MNVIHWSEDTDRARLVREVFRSLPPKVWDVTVWHPLDPVPRNVEPVSGAVEVADAHRLIDAILTVYCEAAAANVVLHQPPEPSIVPRETSGSGFAV